MEMHFERAKAGRLTVPCEKGTGQVSPTGSER